MHFVAVQIAFFAWVLLAIAVIGMVLLKAPNCRLKGVITRKLIFKIPPREIWAGPNSSLMRAIIIAFVSAPLAVSLPEFFAGAPYAILTAVVWIDDYMADDDRWKKLRKSVRNKLKWKMKLPVVVPLPHGA